MIFCLQGFQCQMENVKLDLIMCYLCFLLMVLMLMSVSGSSYSMIWNDSQIKYRDNHKLEIKCWEEDKLGVTTTFFCFFSISDRGTTWSELCFCTQPGLAAIITPCHLPLISLDRFEQCHLPAQGGSGIVKLTVRRKKDKIKVTHIH